MKNKAWIVRAVVISVGSAVIALGGFQNCAQPSDIPMDGGSSQSSLSSSSSSNALKLTVPLSMAPGSNYQLQASGGKPPYSFFVVSGGASLNGSTLQAGGSESSVVVAVMDSQGGRFDASVEIRNSSSLGSSGSSCITPWGQVVASGNSVTAFKESSVCSQTGTCSSEVRICNNGNLSGTFTNQNCSQATCKTFSLFSSTGCINGYCSCHDTATAQANKANGTTICLQANANAICKYKGYAKASAFTCKNGPTSRRQCDADGRNCFTNYSSANTVCETVTCSN